MPRSAVVGSVTRSGSGTRSIGSTRSADRNLLRKSDPEDEMKMAVEADATIEDEELLDVVNYSEDEDESSRLLPESINETRLQMLKQPRSFRRVCTYVLCTFVGCGCVAFGCTLFLLMVSQWMYGNKFEWDVSRLSAPEFSDESDEPAVIDSVAPNTDQQHGNKVSPQGALAPDVDAPVS